MQRESIVTEPLVLLVEKDTAVSHLIRCCLQGLDVIAVTGMAKACQIAQTRPDVALVISGYLLEDGNGVELLEWVRQNLDLPSILFSSSYTPIGTERFVVLRKPFDFHRLPHMVKGALQR